MQLQVEELKQLHIAGRADLILLNNNETLRLFVGSQTNQLCYYKKGSSRRGYALTQENLSNLKAIKVKSEKLISKDDQAYKLIKKFKDQAKKANFTNKFIKDCLKLPDSKEEWEMEGKKNLYNYEISTGNRIEGQIVTVKTIIKKLHSQYQDQILEAIRDKKDFSLSRFNFNGYDGSLQFTKDENGDFKGYFSKEFRNCGNGYYYLLINEDNFIGYDID